MEREELQDASWHREYGQGSRGRLGSKQARRSCPCSPQQTEPNIPLICTGRKWQRVSFWGFGLVVFCFFKLKVTCTFFKADGQPVPQALSLTSEASAFHRAANVAAFLQAR